VPLTALDHPNGVVELVVDHPPVNALPVALWEALAAELRRNGARPEVRAVVLRAEGRGFNAGVDLRELQGVGPEAIVGVNTACYNAFSATYETHVPVVIAIQGHCLGGGIGLAGNSDVLLASDDAWFALPEVERGALGAATHLARLVPPLKARAMLLTGARATAAELQAWGTLHAVVPRAALRGAALEVAQLLASRDPVVMRAAKAALRDIDPVDPRRSYRMEQGYTFELNLLGAGARNRAAFLGGKG
jgi:enoyl-CoA hydratase